IGFNEPGTPFGSLTHRVRLTESTREANRRFFPPGEEPPTEAITMGVRSIMQARRILVLATGEAKAEAVAKAILGPVTEEVPASVLQLHPNVTWWLDEAAAHLLEPGLRWGDRSLWGPARLGAAGPAVGGQGRDGSGGEAFSLRSAGGGSHEVRVGDEAVGGRQERGDARLRGLGLLLRGKHAAGPHLQLRRTLPPVPGSDHSGAPGLRHPGWALLPEPLQRPPGAGDHEHPVPDPLPGGVRRGLGPPLQGDPPAPPPGGGGGLGAGRHPQRAEGPGRAPGPGHVDSGYQPPDRAGAPGPDLRTLRGRAQPADDDHHHLLRLQARGALGRRPGLRRPLPAQPSLRPVPQGFDGQRPAGGRVRAPLARGPALLAGDRAVPGLPAAQLRPGGEEPSGDRRRLYWRAAPIGGDGQPPGRLPPVPRLSGGGGAPGDREAPAEGVREEGAGWLPGVSGPRRALPARGSAPWCARSWPPSCPGPDGAGRRSSPPSSTSWAACCRDPAWRSGPARRPWPGRSTGSSATYTGRPWSWPTTGARAAGPTATWSGCPRKWPPGSSSAPSGSPSCPPPNPSPTRPPTGLTAPGPTCGASSSPGAPSTGRAGPTTWNWSATAPPSMPWWANSWRSAASTPARAAGGGACSTT